MNLRRGFQRLYVVLTVAWIAWWMFVLRPVPGFAAAATLKPSLLESKSYEFATTVDDLLFGPMGEPPEVYGSKFRTEEEADKAFHAQAVWFARHQGVLGYDDRVSTRLIAWSRPIIAAFIPPVAIYLLFFPVGGWICRGFKRDKTERTNERIADKSVCG